MISFMIINNRHSKNRAPSRALLLFRFFLYLFFFIPRCSTQLTAKLTAAPMAASTAVLTMSCMPSWATTLSKVPLPVPRLSCTLFIFIVAPFPVTHAVFHGLKHAQR